MITTPQTRAQYRQKLAERRAYQKRNPLAYGGQLRNTRAGRAKARPLSNRQTMHLVLRSTRATGNWSFKRPANAHKIAKILGKFSARYGVKILSVANVGNHLHLHAQVTGLHGYNPFIRAVTAAIVMAITGASRWTQGAGRGKFWDYRPFTRLVINKLGHLRLTDYIGINHLEGLGISRVVARWVIKKEREEFG